MTTVPKVDALVLVGLDAKLRELRDLIRELETYRNALDQPRQTSLIGQDDPRIAALNTKENQLRVMWERRKASKTEPRRRRNPAQIRAMAERSLAKLGKATVMQLAEDASIAHSLARKYLNLFVQEGTATKNGSAYSPKKKTNGKTNTQ